MTIGGGKTGTGIRSLEEFAEMCFFMDITRDDFDRIATLKAGYAFPKDIDNVLSQAREQSIGNFDRSIHIAATLLDMVIELRTGGE